MPPMMRCGHAANSTTEDGKPCCVICHGIVDGSNMVEANPIDFTGRRARCLYFGQLGSRNRNEGPCRPRPCDCEHDSNPDLPFFEHRPTQQSDTFYCGCAFGWD